MLRQMNPEKGGIPRIRSCPRSRFISYSISTGTKQYPWSFVSLGVRIVQPMDANLFLCLLMNARMIGIGSPGIRVGSCSNSTYAASQSSVMVRFWRSRRASMRAAKILAYFPLNSAKSHSGLALYRSGLPHCGQFNSMQVMSVITVTHNRMPVKAFWLPTLDSNQEQNG